MNKQFVPILLGSDFNAYGMARAFYDKYGIKSTAYAVQALAPTRYSNIIDVNIMPGLDTEEKFLECMLNISKKLDYSKKYFLISCSDGYTELVSKYKEELQKIFICPYIDYRLASQLLDKVSFYRVCEEYNLPYPKTLIINKKDSLNPSEIVLPFEFPIALKPANSIEWLKIHFEGRKKAFVLNSRSEFDKLIKTIYEAGYTDKMIAQDYIPGDDSNMRVLNAYVDQNHKVRMMCLGHPLLEDPTPSSIGNYTVIMPDYNEEVYIQIKNFLENINYTGFANFDMKYDARDGKYKLFEINLRQGRSSFYCTLNGYNLASYLVDDYIEHTNQNETIFAKGNKVWLNVPISVFKKYASNNEYKKQALEMIKSGNTGSTAFYKKDKSIKHKLLMKYAFYNFKKNYDTYFNKEIH